MISQPILLMNNFTLYMIASEKATLSLVCSVSGGVLNMVLDYVLIALCDLGIAGAAIATGLGYSVTAVVGLVVFCRKTSLLHFTKPAFRPRALLSAASNGCSEMATRSLVGVFAKPGDPVYALAVTGNRICSIALLFIGFNIFASGMFTALSNGAVSAALAFSRSFVFMLAALVVLPALFGIPGIWLSTPTAEGMTLILSAFMFFKCRKRYCY